MNKIRKFKDGGQPKPTYIDVKGLGKVDASLLKQDYQDNKATWFEESNLDEKYRKEFYNTMDQLFNTATTEGGQIDVSTNKYHFGKAGNEPITTDSTPLNRTKFSNSDLKNKGMVKIASSIFQNKAMGYLSSEAESGTTLTAELYKSEFLNTLPKTSVGKFDVNKLLIDLTHNGLLKEYFKYNPDINTRITKLTNALENELNKLDKTDWKRNEWIEAESFEEYKSKMKSLIGSLRNSKGDVEAIRKILYDNDAQILEGALILPETKFDTYNSNDLTNPQDNTWSPVNYKNLTPEQRRLYNAASERPDFQPINVRVHPSGLMYFGGMNSSYDYTPFDSDYADVHRGAWIQGIYYPEGTNLEEFMSPTEASQIRFGSTLDNWEDDSNNDLDITDLFPDLGETLNGSLIKSKDDKGTTKTYLEDSKGKRIEITIKKDKDGKYVIYSGGSSRNIGKLDRGKSPKVVKSKQKKVLGPPRDELNPAYDFIIPEWRFPTSHFKEGGIVKMLTGGDPFAEYDKSKLTRAPNKPQTNKPQTNQPSETFDFDDLSGLDLAELIATSADLVATLSSVIAPHPITGAASGLTGLASTGILLKRDIDNGAGFWSTLGNASVGVGSSLLGAIPLVGAWAKAPRTMKMVTNLVSNKKIAQWILGLTGAAGTGAGFLNGGGQALNELFKTGKLPKDLSGIKALLNDLRLMSGFLVGRGFRKTPSSKQINVNIPDKPATVIGITPQEQKQIAAPFSAKQKTATANTIASLKTGVPNTTVSTSRTGPIGELPHYVGEKTSANIPGLNNNGGQDLGVNIPYLDKRYINLAEKSRANYAKITYEPKVIKSLTPKSQRLNSNQLPGHIKFADLINAHNGKYVGTVNDIKNNYDFHLTKTGNDSYKGKIKIGNLVRDMTSDEISGALYSMGIKFKYGGRISKILKAQSGTKFTPITSWYNDDEHNEQQLLDNITPQDNFNYGQLVNRDNILGDAISRLIIAWKNQRLSRQEIMTRFNAVQRSYNRMYARTPNGSGAFGTDAGTVGFGTVNEHQKYFQKYMPIVDEILRGIHISDNPVKDSERGANTLTFDNYFGARTHERYGDAVLTDEAKNILAELGLKYEDIGNITNFDKYNLTQGAAKKWIIPIDEEEQLGQDPPGDPNENNGNGDKEPPVEPNPDLEASNIGSDLLPKVKNYRGFNPAPLYNLAALFTSLWGNRNTPLQAYQQMPHRHEAHLMDDNVTSAHFNKQAASMRTKGNTPITSDGAMQLAFNLDANVKANQANDKARMATKQMFDKTSALVKQTSDHNIEVAADVANKNLAIANQVTNENINRKDATRKDNVKDIVNYLGLQAAKWNKYTEEKSNLQKADLANRHEEQLSKINQKYDYLRREDILEAVNNRQNVTKGYNELRRSGKSATMLNQIISENQNKTDNDSKALVKQAQSDLNILKLYELILMYDKGSKQYNEETYKMRNHYFNYDRYIPFTRRNYFLR